MDMIMNSRQVAEMAGVSYETVLRAVKENALEARKVGNVYLIMRSDAIVWMADRIKAEADAKWRKEAAEKMVNLCAWVPESMREWVRRMADGKGVTASRYLADLVGAEMAKEGK